jgi:hypothetical protein
MTLCTDGTLGTPPPRRGGCAVGLVAFVIVGCVADNTPPLWKEYRNWESGLKALDHYGCLDSPWLSSAENDDEVYVYSCTCWYDIPSCDGDTSFSQDKPVQVLAHTANHAESCGETKCRAWVATQPLTKFGKFTCKPDPIKSIQKWDGLESAPLPATLPPLPEWYHPRLWTGPCP